MKPRTREHVGRALVAHLFEQGRFIALLADVLLIFEQTTRIGRRRLERILSEFLHQCHHALDRADHEHLRVAREEHRSTAEDDHDEDRLRGWADVRDDDEVCRRRERSVQAARGAGVQREKS